MRILQFHRQTYGGIATHVHQLTELLTEAGHEVGNLSGEDKIGPIPSFWSDRQFVGHLRTLASNYDLVHAHGYMPAWLCGGLRGTQWVYTAHSVLRKTRFNPIPRMNKAKAGICVSRFVENQIGGMGASRLRLNPGGILVPPLEDMPKWQAKQRFAIPENTPVIGALGRLVPEKGFDQLIRAMKEVWWEQNDAILLLSGEGPEREPLNRLKHESQRPENVRLLGKWTHAHEVYQACDLFVMPSVSEALGLAALEAAACGAPVLARKTGGMSELFEDRVSGIYFEGDESSLATAITESLASPTLLAAIARAGRVRVEERFDLRKNLGGILDVYLTARDVRN